MHTGCGIADGKCLPCSGILGGSAVSSYSSSSDCKFLSNVKIAFRNNLPHESRKMIFSCRASSSSQKGNPNFSRQSRQGQGFSRSKNQKNQEKINNRGSTDEVDLLSSRNGPLLSLSGSPRFQATAAPGPREKEIVELFRKVQAQLRQRSGLKEGKRVEASQVQGERETVDSLLKLLRKHSNEQGKKNNTRKEFSMDNQDRDTLFDDEQNHDFFDSNNIEEEEVQEPKAASSMRPASNFQRRSPVPKIKYQPVFSSEAAAEQSTELIPSSELRGKEESVIHPEREAVGLDLHEDALDEVLDPLDPKEVSNQDYNPSSAEATDLGSLKLPELRALAKSRGLKGFSRLKKNDLLGLLNDNLVGASNNQ